MQWNAPILKINLKAGIRDDTFGIHTGMLYVLIYVFLIIL